MLETAGYSDSISQANITLINSCQQFACAIFGAFLSNPSAPEERGHDHAAVALINVCEGVAHSTPLSYLAAFVAALLRLLESQVENDVQPKNYAEV